MILRIKVLLLLLFCISTVNAQWNTRGGMANASDTTDGITVTGTIYSDGLQVDGASILNGDVTVNLSSGEEVVLTRATADTFRILPTTSGRAWEYENNNSLVAFLSDAGQGMFTTLGVGTGSTTTFPSGTDMLIKVAAGDTAFGFTAEAVPAFMDSSIFMEITSAGVPQIQFRAPNGAGGRIFYTSNDRFIFGDLAGANSIIFNTDGSTTNGIAFDVNSGGQLGIRGGAAGTLGGSSQGTIELYPNIELNSGHSSLGEILLKVEGNTYFKIDNNGLIGINETSPAYRLEVEGGFGLGATSTVTLADAGTGTVTAESNLTLDTFGSAALDTVTTLTGGVGQIVIIRPADSGRDIRFLDAGNFSLGAERLLDDVADRLILQAITTTTWAEIGFYNNN